MKLTKKSVLAFLTVLTILCVPVIVFGQAGLSGWDPKSPGDVGLEDNAAFSEILLRILKWLLGILAILAILAFVISGIYYITAGGTPRADTARSWLTGAIVGLVIALLGYVIVITIDAIISGQT